MTFRYVTLTMIGLLMAGNLASAQIISQTPRPEVPDEEAEKVEILKPSGRVGRVDNTVKVVRPAALVFAGFDQNADYSLDRAEVRAGIDAAFNAADVDDSGSLSLVELEAWREKALGSLDEAPHNYAFAPNFARSVSLETFRTIMQKVADTLDTNDQGITDGKIPFSDLLRNQRAPRIQKDEGEESCTSRILDERRRAEQQCRNQRGY